LSPAAGWLCRRHPPSSATMIREDENMKKMLVLIMMVLPFFAYKYWFENEKRGEENMKKCWC
jgi:hypothetical protein